MIIALINQNYMKKMHFSKLACIAVLSTISDPLFSQTVDSISNKTLIKKINQSFGSIATGQGDAVNLTNYGSFDPTNGALKFNVFGALGNTEKKIAPFFNLNIAGKVIGDNSAVLFNNSKFNSGTAVGLKLHFAISPIPNFSGNEIDTINRRIELLNAERSTKKRQFREQLSRERLKVQKANDSVKLVNLKTLQNAYQKEIDSIQVVVEAGINDTSKLLKLTNTYLDLFRKKQQLDIDSLTLEDKIKSTDTFLADTLSIFEAINSFNYTADTSYDSKRESLEMSASVKGFSMSWLSIVSNIERKKYYSFSDIASFITQLSEKKYTTSQFGLEYNLSRFSGKQGNPLPSEKSSIVSVLNIGFVRLRNNNIGDLTTTELTDSRRYVSRDSTHTLATKYNVFTDKITEYKAWKIYTNFYRSIGQKRNSAIHLFSDVEFRDSDETPINFGLGFIFAMKNKKDNAVLNVEFFGKLVDIAKALPQDENSTIRRNVLGVNFGVPLNLVINKK